MLFSANLLLGQLQIDQIDSTPATCETNGALVVTASGGDESGAGYLYSLIEPSPQLRPNQSSNSFTSLEPGTYTVQVTDNSGTMETSTAVVEDLYNEPVISTVDVNNTSCESSVDGTATVNETNNATALPLEYTLYNGNTPTGPIVAGPQGSNMFEGLAVGQYTVLVVDQCDIQYPFTFVVGTSAVSLEGDIGGVQYDCDVALQSIGNFTGGQAPYTYEVILDNTDTQYSTGVFNPGDKITVPYDEPFTIKITESGCSEVLELNNQIENSPVSDNVTVSGGCGDGQARINLNSAGFVCADIDYCYRLTSQEALICGESPLFTGLSDGDYVFVVRDNCCMNEYTGTFGIGGAAAYISEQRFDEGCIPGTNTFMLRHNNFGNNITTELISATPDYTYTDQDGQTQVVSSNYAVGSMFTIPHHNRLEFGSVPPGSYTFRSTDECGNDVTYTLEVTPDEVVVPVYYAEFTPACSGNTDLRVGVRNGGGRDLSNASGGTFIEVLDSDNNSVFVKDRPLKVSDGDYIVSVAPGTYTINYNNNSRGANTLYGTCPSTYTKTIEVYNALPPDLSRSEFYMCTDDATIIAEVIDGTPEFNYSIRELGEETWSAEQTSNVFTGLDDTKTYEVQVIDGCFRNNINQVTAEGVIGAPSVMAGFNCIGNTETATAVSLTTNEVFGAEYEWKNSAGTVIGTTREVTINPLVVGETYTVTTSIPGDSGDCIAASNQYSITTDNCAELALPVELASFNVKLLNESSALIEWVTVAEIDHDYFELQRSTDAHNWETVEVVYGEGDSQTEKRYEFIDKGLEQGLYYYQLKSVSLSGDIQNSEKISLRVFLDSGEVVIVPNPTRAGNSAMVSLPANIGQCTYSIIDVKGTQVVSNVINSAKQSYIETEGLLPGIYFVTFSNNSHWTSQPIKLLVY